MKKVLFVCVHNSARSQIAEELLRKLSQGNFIVESAGLEPETLNPYVVEILKEEGIDISNKKTNSAFEFFRQGRKYNYVVTVCSESEGDRCPVFPGLSKRLHWSYDDPSNFKGSDKEIKDQVRKLKEDIKKRVIEFIEEYRDKA